MPLCLLFALAPRAHAQALPDAGEVMGAFQALRARVGAWGAAADSPVPDPAGATGASVTLRLAGRVIGRGVTFEGDHKVSGAFDQAWNEASNELVVEKDALADQHRDALAARIAIDLEVSGELRPLLGATFGAASARLSPGVDGVAIREGERIAGVFPGAQLSTGILPERAFRVAAGKLALPPTELDRIRRDHDVTLYTFRAQHLAQPTPEQAPEFLHRGGEHVPLADVTGATLRATADAIAAHLITHAWTGPEPNGLRGDYHPTVGTYEPLIADPLAQGLVAFSLARYARTPGVDSETASRALKLAGAVLKDLTVVGADEADPTADPVASAIWIAAWAEVNGGNADAPQDDDLAKFAPLALDAINRGMTTPHTWASTPPGAKALVAYALIRAAGAGLDAGATDKARTIVGDLFAGSSSAQLASLMPWLAWAELELFPTGKVPAEIALRDFRALVWEFQLNESPADSTDADLSGGVVFTTGGLRLPTWQTLRPVAAIASMLASPALTREDELGAEVASVRRSLRFLIQLTIRDAELWMVQSVHRAKGGVRLALWDQTEGLDANATGLLTVCEVLRAVASRSHNTQPAAAP